MGNSPFPPSLRYPDQDPGSFDQTFMLAPPAFFARSTPVPSPLNVATGGKGLRTSSPQPLGGLGTPGTPALAWLQVRVSDPTEGFTPPQHSAFPLPPVTPGRFLFLFLTLGVIYRRCTRCTGDGREALRVSGVVTEFGEPREGPRRGSKDPCPVVHVAESYPATGWWDANADPLGHGKWTSGQPLRGCRMGSHQSPIRGLGSIKSANRTRSRLVEFP